MCTMSNGPSILLASARRRSTTMESIFLVILVVLVVGGIVLAKRAGWFTGTDQELRQAERAEDIARSQQHHPGPYGH